MSHHKPDPNVKVNVTINGIPVTVPEGTRILEAARQANIKIPTLCDHPDLCKRAICRICVVEADGRGKLIAACANDVWEGVNIVTNNIRLLNVRKTILELILANHPQDCLSCVRNTSCELQSLAAEYNIRKTPYEPTEKTISAKNTITEEIIVRDMDKCVKCGRCVAACQEAQGIGAINTANRSHDFNITTPYHQSLADSSCIFCGQCAKVCPVGAIYGQDQSDQVWNDLKDQNRKTIAQVSAQMAELLEKELNYSKGAISPGKMIAAIKRLGFDQIYDSSILEKEYHDDLLEELQTRLRAKDANSIDKLPMISGFSESCNNFIRVFYHKLATHYTYSCMPRQHLSEIYKDTYAFAHGINQDDITSVTFVPGIAYKYYRDAVANDYALTPAELARMIKRAGIDITSLPEEDFDFLDLYDELNEEFEFDSNFAPVKITVHGFAEARKVMEQILKGECNADWVDIQE